MQIIRSALYESKFLEDLDRNPKSENVQKQALKIYDRLNMIYRTILVDLKDLELLPSPKEILIDPDIEKKKGIAV